MSTIINLTPHAITFVLDGQMSVTIPPSGLVARVAVQRWFSGIIRHGDLKIPVYRSVFGPVEGLPEPTPGTYYLVSRMTAEAARDRGDLVIVDDTVRDDQGRVIGCRALAVV